MLERLTRPVGHRRDRWRRWLLTVVAAAATPVVVAAVAATPLVHAWALQTADAVSTWEGVGWSVLQAAMTWAVPPALALVVGSLVVRLWRAGARYRAAGALAVAFGSFLTSEVLKLVPVPFPVYDLGGYRPLSGHVAAAAATAAVVVVASPPRSRAGAALVAGLGLVGVQLGVVASRWHTAPDIVLPAVVAASWAAGVGATCAVRYGPARRSARTGAVQWWLFVVGLAGTVTVVVSVVTRAVAGASALVVVGYAAVAATSLALVVLLGAAGALDRAPDSGSLER